MQDSEHKNTVVFRAKVEAIFAKRIAFAAIGKLRSWASQASVLREVTELNRESLNQMVGLKWTVPRDVVPNLLEIETSGEGKINLPHGLGALCFRNRRVTLCEEFVYVKVADDFASINLTDGDLNVCTQSC